MPKFLPLFYVAGLVAWGAALTVWAIGVKDLGGRPCDERETRLRRLSNRLMIVLVVSSAGVLGATIISLVLDGPEPGPGVLRDVVLAVIGAVVVECVVMRALLQRVASRLAEKWAGDVRD